MSDMTKLAHEVMCTIIKDSRTGTAMKMMMVSPATDAFRDAIEDALREAASRLRAPAVAEVEVKPLEWVPVEEWKRCSKERAPAFGGEYQIVMLDPDDEPLPSLYFEIGLGAFMFRFEQGQDPMGLPGETCPRKFPSVEAAKAAAQADYERRIRSALRTGGSE